MFNMTGPTRWACLLAGFMLMFAHVQTAGVSIVTESYEELLQAVKSGTFSLDGKNQDFRQNKALLQQILDKSKLWFNGTAHMVNNGYSN